MVKKAKKAMPARKKTKMGRPRTNPTHVGLTLLPDTLAALERYAAKQGTSKMMAARHILEAFFARKKE